VIDEIRLTYAALAQAQAPRRGDLRVHQLDRVGNRIQLGLDDEGREHLLVESPQAPERESGIAAITTAHRDLLISDALARYLDVTCQHRELVEVFDHFVAAVAERADPDDPDLGLVVAMVLDRWRSFFTTTGAPPGRETVTGVFGELLLLRDIAARNVEDVLATWVGPRGGRHDFRRGSAAVEVKTSRAHTSRVVSIHGEDQLLEPQDATLHLQFVRLEEVAGLGLSINDLIDELTTGGVPRVELLEVITDAGIPPASLATVGTIRFQVRERLTLPVNDDTPRIIPASFAAGARPVGVVDLTYRIDLDHVATSALADRAYDELLGRLVPGL